MIFKQATPAAGGSILINRTELMSNLDNGREIL